MSANPLAQGIELVSAIERSIEIIDLLLLQPNEPICTTATKVKQGSGSACIEAPRGLLIHSYTFDSHGLCTAAEIITPTVFNQLALREDLTAVASGMDGMTEDAIAASLQKLVRCYDPCISCAVHVVRNPFCAIAE
jgi:coenzyme F420-reducing hydrogenase alpha subunit